MRGIPEILTPKELAELFGVHPETVRVWIRRGLLKGWRVGGRLFIHVRDALAFVRPPRGRPRKKK